MGQRGGTETGLFVGGDEGGGRAGGGLEGPREEVFYCDFCLSRSESFVVPHHPNPLHRHTTTTCMDDLNCALCLRLFYDPVSTSCGHTFCRVCLIRSLNTQRRCPVCRMPCLLSLSNPPVNVVIQNMLERQFPQEYSERRQEMLSEMDELRRSHIGHEVPVLVLKEALYVPGMLIRLRLFEPRYIEMAQEATQADRSFSILSIHRSEAVGFVCELRDVGVERYRRELMVTLFVQKRFVCREVHEQGSQAIPVESIDDRVFKGQRVVYCLPEVLVDIPDDDELGEQVMECTHFLREAVRKLSPVTQRELRDTFTHEVDDTLSLVLQLAIPFSAAFTAVKSVNRAGRVMLVHQWIQGKKPNSRALRITEGEVTLNTPRNSVLFIVCLMAFLVLGWALKQS